MSKPKSKRSKYLLTTARLLVVALGVAWVIVWLSRGQRWANLAATFSRMNLGFFTVALAAYVFGQVIVGFRWWLLLKTQAISLSIPAAIRLQFLGLFYNNFMPSSVGGDLLRAWYVTKHTNRKFEAALSVFIDRIIGLFSTLIIAGFFYAVFLRGNQTGLAFEGKSGAIEFCARHKTTFFWVAGVLIAIFCILLLVKPTRVKIAGIWSRIRTRGIAIAKKTKNAVILYCRHPLTILVVFVLTVIMQVGVITSFWLVGRSMGIQASVKYYYVFFTLTWVLGAVPVSVGGAVVVEGLLAYLFVQVAGVQAELALALALCQRIVWLMASLPGGVIHLIGAHLPKDFSIDYDEVID